MLNAARWTVLGLLAISVLVLAFAIGYVLADDDASASPRVNSQNNGQDLEGDVDFETLNQIVKLLDDRYVEPDRIDEQALYEAAINGMLQTLSDSGTFYVDPVTVATSTGPSGSFEGITFNKAWVGGNITIVGAGAANTTIASTNGLAAFYVSAPAPGVIRIDNMKITNSAGGGVRLDAASRFLGCGAPEERSGCAEWDLAGGLDASVTGRLARHWNLGRHWRDHIARSERVHVLLGAQVTARIE